MLPLVEGMPVMLTDHVDRNPEKNLLRGRIGWIRSWELGDNEKSRNDSSRRSLTKLPKAVYVKFMVEKEGKLVDPEWKVGSLERGVYPIVPQRSEWFLDKGRAHPMLSVTRWQLPLAPGFAITTHASQGQTLEAAIVDMQIGKEHRPFRVMSRSPE